MLAKTATRALYAALDIPERMKAKLAKAKLRHYAIIDPEAEIGAGASINNQLEQSAVRIGKRTLFMGEIICYARGGSVSIGDFSYVGPGAKIWSMVGVRIGNNVQISHGAHIFDNNSHSTVSSERVERFKELRTVGHHSQPENIVCKPVVIEDDSWIGFNAAIMKGVTVGRGAIVAAGAIVTKDVPPFTIVAGNPAREVKRIND